MSIIMFTCVAKAVTSRRSRESKSYQIQFKTIVNEAKVSMLKIHRMLNRVITCETYPKMEHLHAKPKNLRPNWPTNLQIVIPYANVESHYIHTQHGVLFVAHKAIIVRTSKISSCLSHIFLILTGVSQGGRKITTTRKHLTISFGA